LGRIAQYGGERLLREDRVTARRDNRARHGSSNRRKENAPFASTIPDKRAESVMGEKKFRAQLVRSPDERRINPDGDKPPWVRRYLELADLLLERAERRLGSRRLKSEKRSRKTA